MAGRGAWRQSRHRRLPRFCSDAVPHRLAMRPRFLLLPSPSGRRWRRRRHRTCVHRRARWRAPPWGTQRRTRHRRITTVSSTSGGFHRRRRRRLRGRQAVGRSTTYFGAGCAAQRAAWAPSPPHLHSTRARSAPSIRAAGTIWPDLGVRAQLLRSARASRRAAKGAGKSMANGEMVGSTNNSTFCPSSDAPGAGRSEAEAEAKKVGRSKKLNYWCSQPGPQKGVSPTLLWEHQDIYDFTHVTGTGKKTPGGAGTHTGHTGHADAQRHTDHTDEPHNHPNPPTTHTPHVSGSARRPKPRPTQQPQARSRPLPAADSEEAAPSEPDPASTRSQSASPRLLESGRRNEGACGRRVAAGSAAGAPDKLETREAEAGMRNGRGEADLGAQRRDHEGSRVEHGRLQVPVKRHRGEPGVEAYKAGITLFAADCWSTAAHHCAWPTASSGWWPPPLLPVPLAILSLLLQPLLRLLRRDHPSPASSRQAGQPCCGHRHGHPCGRMSSPLRRKEGRMIYNDILYRK